MHIPTGPSVGPGDADAVAAVHEPSVACDAIRFVALPDGSMLVDDDQADVDPSRLAGAVEETLAPPYRANCVREEGDLWAVSARAIQVIRLALAGDHIELTRRAGETRLSVDGAHERTIVPELERLGEAAGEDYAVIAHRLDGDVWEVTVSVL